MTVRIAVLDHPAWVPLDYEFDESDTDPDLGTTIAGWRLDAAALNLAEGATASLRSAGYDHTNWSTETVLSMLDDGTLAEPAQVEEMDLPDGPAISALWRFVDVIDGERTVHQAVAVFIPVPGVDTLLILSSSNHSLVAAAHVVQPLLELAYGIIVEPEGAA